MKRKRPKCKGCEFRGHPTQFECFRCIMSGLHITATAMLQMSSRFIAPVGVTDDFLSSMVHFSDRLNALKDLLEETFPEEVAQLKESIDFKRKEEIDRMKQLMEGDTEYRV